MVTWKISPAALTGIMFISALSALWQTDKHKTIKELPDLLYVKESSVDKSISHNDLLPFR